MVDVFTPEKRSYVMSRIRSKNTKIERIMKTILQKNNFEFVEHPNIFGKPDFLVAERTVIFCDGDFWHGYNYGNKRKPPKKFWKNKMEGNIQRDQIVSRKLRREGWSVLRFWEHDIEKKPEKCLRRIRLKIKNKNRILVC